MGELKYINSVETKEYWKFNVPVIERRTVHIWNPLQISILRMLKLYWLYIAENKLSIFIFYNISYITKFQFRHSGRSKIPEYILKGIIIATNTGFSS